MPARQSEQPRVRGPELRVTRRAVDTLASAMSAYEPQAVGTSLPIDYDKRLMLFSGRANPQLAAAIADRLAVDLGPITLRTFSGGEVYCRYDESIRGADVFIVQPTCANPATGISANDALMELLVMIDAAAGASAHRVIAVTPWFAYSRQDKKSALREPISARLVAHMLEAAGADRVLTMDLHAGQVQGFFTKPVDHMTALFMLAKYFADLRLPDLVVVAPDVGRAKLNLKFAEVIGADLALMTKERPAHQVAEIGHVIGDVKGKTAVIVDDIIDTAGTLSAAGQTVLDAGAARVYAAATHGVFSGAAYETLAAAAFEQIVVTDTIPTPPGPPESIVVLPCAGLLTDSIRRIFTDASVSEVFGGENQLF
jgi:ribose-phosphate pyrophosphokinase